MRPAVAFGAALVLTVALPGCRDGGVHVSFRPPVGARYSYDVRVRSVTTTRLGDDEPQRSVDEAVLRAEHVVLGAGPQGARVRVELRRAGSPARTFVVRFDRAAQLEDVETVEGLPASVLGRIDLAELFPAAAGAPPDRPLSPGERWSSDKQFRLPDGRRARLENTGRLVSLGVVHGHKVASLRTETRLPLTSTTDIRGGRLSLDGIEVTGIEATRDLSDGSVRSASSVTRGTFRLSLSPPAATAGAPVTGTLEVVVRSETKRAR